MVLAMERQGSEFEMPGTGTVDFDRHARAIAKAGIYDYQIHHDVILVPVVLRQWGVEQLTGLSDAAERARESLLKRIERIGRAGRRMARQREEQARAEQGGDKVPVEV